MATTRVGPFAIMGFTGTDGESGAIDTLADRARLRLLDLAVLDEWNSFDDSTS